MFFLSKKRIMVLGIFLLAVLAIGISQIFIEPETVETVALPVSNKVIVIDAGHGEPDEGGSLLHQVKNRSNYFFIKNNCRCKSLQFF